MNLYEILVKKMSGEEIKLDEFKGKVLLIVNTASKCGFTPQFAGLEELYEEFKEKDFVILGFPCNQFLGQDPKSNEEILEFCQLNYGVTFPMFEKILVRGKNQHELYNYLINNSPTRKGKSIKWNFEKFLINRNGEIVDRYESKVAPNEIKEHIEKLL
jgi:glutathione peroxidase